jgi:hypothetical protein
MLEMKTVMSSHVWQAGHDPETGELHVRYQPTVKNPAGAVVVYVGVDAETAEKVLSSESIGQALHQNIRGRFETR